MLSSSRSTSKLSTTISRAVSSAAASVQTVLQSAPAAVSSAAASVQTVLQSAPARGFGSAVEKQALGPKSAALVDIEEKYAAHNYHPLPVVFAEAHGCRVTYVYPIISVVLS